MFIFHSRWAEIPESQEMVKTEWESQIGGLKNVQSAPKTKEMQTEIYKVEKGEQQKL